MVRSVGGGAGSNGPGATRPWAARQRRPVGTIRGGSRRHPGRGWPVTGPGGGGRPGPSQSHRAGCASAPLPRSGFGASGCASQQQPVVAAARFAAQQARSQHGFGVEAGETEAWVGDVGNPAGVRVDGVRSAARARGPADQGRNREQQAHERPDAPRIGMKASYTRYLIAVNSIPPPVVVQFDFSTTIRAVERSAGRPRRPYARGSASHTTIRSKSKGAARTTCTRPADGRRGHEGHGHAQINHRPRRHPHRVRRPVAELH